MPFIDLELNYCVKKIIIVIMLSEAKNNTIYLYCALLKEELFLGFSLLIMISASTLMPVRGTVEKIGSGQNL